MCVWWKRANMYAALHSKVSKLTDGDNNPGRAKMSQIVLINICSPILLRTNVSTHKLQRAEAGVQVLVFVMVLYYLKQ